MLPLFGVAESAVGVDSNRPWQVLRLKSPSEVATHAADTALIRRESDLAAAMDGGFRRVLSVGSNTPVSSEVGVSHIVLSDQFSYLAEGDLLGYQPTSRRFRTLYRRSSRHNSFLVTERCNHYCLMCSQPPRKVDDGWLLDEIEDAIELVHPETKSFAFTGGEPLTDWPRFISVLGRCRDLLPNTAIHVLTNGRAFAKPGVAKAWAELRHSNLMAGIPIYSAVDHIHDYVVQSAGAFDETILGILKLKNEGQRVEIRVVLHAITAPRIAETCRWIGRNLPFVDHIALMGLENTGFTLANSDILWIDPADYQDQLALAVEGLAAAKLPVSVYNLPRCVLPRSVWPFALQSISDWKNGYAAECARCVERPQCAGFFTSGRPKRSRAISPILAEAAQG